MSYSLERFGWPGAKKCRADANSVAPQQSRRQDRRMDTLMDRGVQSVVPVFQSLELCLHALDSRRPAPRGEICGGMH